jgi:hypothetical protein
MPKSPMYAAPTALKSTLPVFLKITTYRNVGAHIAAYVVSTAAYFAVTTPPAETGAVSSVSMVPLRRSSAKVRIVSAGHTSSSVISRNTDSCPKYASIGPVSTARSARLEK